MFQKSISKSIQSILSISKIIKKKSQINKD